MRPWATRTAKTALLAAGFAAAAGGLSGVALAAGGNRNISLGSGNTARTPCFSLLPTSRRNRLAQALFRLELRMCGLGV
jgi:hypothetical protein